MFSCPVQFLMFNQYKNQSFSSRLVAGCYTNTAETHSAQNTQLLALKEMAH